MKTKTINLRSFRQRVRYHKTALRRFLSRLEKHPPARLDAMTTAVEKEVWEEVDCLTCANCCKTMTPTYTPGDIRRIAAHFRMTPDQFRAKWLTRERSSGDWMNKSTPCQFLNLENNKCSIYAIRPVDCAGFPHLPKRRMVDYMHVHKQNLEYCPATYKMVEKIRQRIDQGAGS
ncbi:MAG TPA: YkgJ family cysteine cluster protein [Chitinophagaceae bacterium]|nr:YkgJ family cysteine cluster protein [Chitinophagaceae bacterium]